MCREIGRPTHAFVSSGSTIFGHHSAVTSIFSHSNLLKMSQISKCYSSSSLSSIKILINMIDSKFQRKQNVGLRFSILATKKRSSILRKSPLKIYGYRIHVQYYICIYNIVFQVLFLSIFIYIFSGCSCSVGFKF